MCRNTRARTQFCVFNPLTMTCWMRCMNIKLVWQYVQYTPHTLHIVQKTYIRELAILDYLLSVPNFSLCYNSLFSIFRLLPYASLRVCVCVCAFSSPSIIKSNTHDVRPQSKNYKSTCDVVLWIFADVFFIFGFFGIRLWYRYVCKYYEVDAAWHRERERYDTRRYSSQMVQYKKKWAFVHAWNGRSSRRWRSWN